MPDQPADPIRNDLRVPLAPKHRDRNAEQNQRDNDKPGTKEANVKREEENPEHAPGIEWIASSDADLRSLLSLSLQEVYSDRW